LKTESLLNSISISADNIKSSTFENGEPVKFYFPILRWKAIKNSDEASMANFPDGYMINSESAGGYPKTIILWRKSKSNDVILFQFLKDSKNIQPSVDGENTLLLVRAKNS